MGLVAAAGAQETELQQIVVDGSGGKVVSDGYVTKRTSTATKTDTPLINVPQSVSVATKEQIKDTGAQKLEDVIRYVPGVVWHQGENNRDQVVIRGQSSSADFFVNGMRDDAQIYRDLYNAERIEVLKGPNALIFGRGGGGGVINRVLKEADGTSIREFTLQGGSFDNKRVTADVGGKTSDTVSARVNAVYEKSGSYRNYVDLERKGINPTVTWRPTAATAVTLSYEYLNDFRHFDRGVPSLNGMPFSPGGTSPFFGNPDLSITKATTNAVMAKIEHAFDNGLKLVNQTRFQDTKRFYQNVYPDNATPVAPNGNVTLAAYNNTNDRQNIINQTDWTYKFDLGTTRHTLLFGTEFANQVSANARFSGVFAPGTNVVSAYSPTTFVNVTFPGIAGDARNLTKLDVAAGYVQDQIELTRWLQLIAGVRFDRFSLGYKNLNGQGTTLGQTFSRVDNLVSPRVGVVVKPMDNISLYASYSVSQLPASGDQFNALATNTAVLAPEKFENKEIGVKWDINPRLTYTAAIYQLDRFNQRIPDPSNTAFFITAGKTRAQGFETTIAGKLTDAWTVTGGYAYTDAHVLSATGTSLAGTIPAGRRSALVPYNQFSLWNRYDFNETWGAGLGVISMSDAFATIDNTVKLPAYARVDGAVFWKLNKNWRAQVNIENINGVVYYPTADGLNNITPGSPRAVRVSLTGSF